MKTIKIPQPVKLSNSDDSPIKDDSGKELPEITFQQFIKNTILIDPKFGKSMADILTAVEIKNKLSTATDTLELENVDYDRLVAVVSEPSSAYNPVVVIQLVEFLLAVKNAK